LGLQKTTAITVSPALRVPPIFVSFCLASGLHDCFLFPLFLLKIINQGKVGKEKQTNNYSLKRRNLLSSAEKQIYKRKKIKSMLFTGRLTAEAA